MSSWIPKGFFYGWGGIFTLPEGVDTSGREMRGTGVNCTEAKASFGLQVQRNDLEFQWVMPRKWWALWKAIG